MISVSYEGKADTSVRRCILRRFQITDNLSNSVLWLLDVALHGASSIATEHNVNDIITVGSCVFTVESMSIRMPSWTFTELEGVTMWVMPTHKVAWLDLFFLGLFNWNIPVQGTPIVDAEPFVKDLIFEWIILLYRMLHIRIHLCFTFLRTQTFFKMVMSPSFSSTWNCAVFWLAWFTRFKCSQLPIKLDFHLSFVLIRYEDTMLLVPMSFSKMHAFVVNFLFTETLTFRALMEAPMSSLLAVMIFLMFLSVLRNH